MYAIRSYYGKNCNYQMTTDGKGKLTPLTPKYKEINSVLERIHVKRKLKKRQDLILDR